MTSADNRVCVVGSLNIDLATRLTRHPRPGETVHARGLTRSPGGKGANQAVAAARAGAATVLVGRIGDDDAGTAYLAGLADRGVDCAAVTVTDGTPSGHAFIAIDDTGENTITVIAGANGLVTAQDIESKAAVIESAGVLLLQFELPPSAVLAAARLGSAAGATVVVNPSPFATIEPDLLAVTDVLVVNEHEAIELGDTGVSTVITAGGDGARWDDIVLPAPPIEPVDTTGAGDAFTGALAAALADGRSRGQALADAIDAGSRACESLGAQGWNFDG